MKLALTVVLSLMMAPATAEAAHHVIVISNMAFGAAPAHLAVGDVIEWRNSDMFRHSATAWMGTFDLDLPPGGHGETILRKPGAINVYCRYHPTMTLRLVVGPRR